MFVEPCIGYARCFRGRNGIASSAIKSCIAENVEAEFAGLVAVSYSEDRKAD